MQRPFTRLAIVNRGEPAMRLIHAVRELNEQRAEPIRLIALYTEAERDAMFVRHADEAVCLGPSTVVGATAPRSGYLDHAALERALRRRPAPTPPGSAGASSPRSPSSSSCASGWGSCSSAPTRPSCAALGDKIAAKRLAEEAGVPVAPWSGGPVDDRRRGAATHAERIGFPLMIKAAAGRRRARHPRASTTPAGCRPRSRAPAPRRCRRSATARVLARAARRAGPPRRGPGRSPTARAPPGRVGVRDCSYQRRNQKVIEESASPALTAEQEREMMAAARPPRAARRLPQRGHGRVPLRAGRAARSRSWRSTRACRSSTPSPRRSPAWTSSSCSSTSPPAAGSRASRRRRSGTRSRRG